MSRWRLIASTLLSTDECSLMLSSLCYNKLFKVSDVIVDDPNKDVENFTRSPTITVASACTSNLSCFDSNNNDNTGGNGEYYGDSNLNRLPSLETLQILQRSDLLLYHLFLIFILYI